MEEITKPFTVHLFLFVWQIGERPWWPMTKPQKWNKEESQEKEEVTLSSLVSDMLHDSGKEEEDETLYELQVLGMNDEIWSIDFIYTPQCQQFLFSCNRTDIDLKWTL